MRPICLVAVVLTAVTAAAQEPRPAGRATGQDRDELTSGPVAGVSVPALPVSAPGGPLAGLELNAVESFGDGPGAVLFVHELTRNIAPLIRAIDAIGDSHAALGLSTTVVMLAADRNAAERQSIATSQSLKLTRPMTVSVDGAEGPGDWSLNRRCTLTLVLCDKGVVQQSIAYTDTGRQDVAKVYELIEKLTGPMPTDPAVLRATALERLPRDPAALRARAAQLTLDLHWQAKMRELAEARPARDEPMRDAAQTDRRQPDAARNAAAQPARVGKAPDDEELRGLLRRAIRKTADSAELDVVFAAIDTRIGDDANLIEQGIEMFRLMLSLEYGTEDAQGRARRWVEAHGGKVPGDKAPDDRATGGRVPGDRAPRDRAPEAPSRRGGD